MTKASPFVVRRYLSAPSPCDPPPSRALLTARREEAELMVMVLMLSEMAVDPLRPMEIEGHDEPVLNADLVFEAPPGYVLKAIEAGRWVWLRDDGGRDIVRDSARSACLQAWADYLTTLRKALAATRRPRRRAKA